MILDVVPTKNSVLIVPDKGEVGGSIQGPPARDLDARTIRAVHINNWNERETREKL